MHRLGAWGLSTALAAGALASTCPAADPPKPADAAAERPWYKRLVGGDDKPEPPEPPASPKAAAAAAPAATPARPPVVTAPLSADALADAVKSEQDAYLRRLAVCTRLRELSIESNDDSLSRQADDLERQATALYHQRVAAMGVKGGRRPSARASEEATASLDRQLGSGSAVTPLTAARPASEAAASTARKTAELREVAP